MKALTVTRQPDLKVEQISSYLVDDVGLGSSE